MPPATKILIIDDSKAMRTFLHYLAHELQFETAEAEDGSQALQVLEGGNEFSVALVDWDMPRMNGLEFVKAVRANPVYDGLKLMMVTTQNSMEHVAAALDSGAADFLMKPVTKESLAEKLLVLGVME
jgi:two-component system chemotaxis response regulator CheY